MVSFHLRAQMMNTNLHVPNLHVPNDSGLNCLMEADKKKKLAELNLSVETLHVPFCRDTARQSLRNATLVMSANSNKPILKPNN